MKKRKATGAQHWARTMALCTAMGTAGIAAQAHQGPATVAQHASTLQVDGDLSDWDTTTQWQRLPFVMNGDPNAPDDVSGEFATAIDPVTGDLYVALRVRDDVLIRDAQTQSVDVLGRNPDGALVYLDLMHRAGFSENIEASLVRRPILAVDQSLQPEDGFAIARRDTETGVAYEWRINLKRIAEQQDATLALGPEMNAVIGFNIEYWDRDGPDDGAVLRWTAGPRDGDDARRLGDVFLQAEPQALQPVGGRAVWRNAEADQSPPRWVHFRRIDAPHVIVHGRVEPEGGFHVKLTPGVWEAYASDPLTLQSAGERIRIEVADRPITLAPPLVARPTELPLEQAIRERMAELGVRTVGVAWIEGNRFRFNQTFGVQADGAPADANTVFRVASITKPVSAMTFLSLVEDGAWSLDTPLAQHAMDPDIAGDPRSERLTMPMALRHLTGLPNWRRGAALSFLYDPMVVQSYSGEGFELTRRAVEAATGQSLQALSEDHVFAPADMTRTTHGWPDWVVADFAGEYFGSGGAVEHATSRQPNAAANLLSTPTDLGKFAIWVNTRRGGLSDDLWAEATTPNPASLRTGRSTAPHALGWIVHQAEDVQVLEHSGGQWGIRTQLITVPETGEALVVLTNSSAGWSLIHLIFNETLNKQGRYNSLEDVLYK